MGRVLRANELVRPANIVYDDTPIQAYMEAIHQRLREEGQVAFSDMFKAGMHKSAMIGVFLAVLELVRHHCVHAEQDAMHGEIYLKQGESVCRRLGIAGCRRLPGCGQATVMYRGNSSPSRAPSSGLRPPSPRRGEGDARRDPADPLLPPGEGARRADEGG